jgi:hypothetical protein
VFCCGQPRVAVEGDEVEFVTLALVNPPCITAPEDSEELAGFRVVGEADVTRPSPHVVAE